MKSTKLLAALIVCAGLSACGGGGGGGGGSGGQPIAGAEYGDLSGVKPTKQLTASQSAADTLKTEMEKGRQSAIANDSLDGLPGPGGTPRASAPVPKQLLMSSVLSSAQPVGQSATEACPEGGSITVNAASRQSFSWTYNNCRIGGALANGSASMNITGDINSGNYSYVARYNNIVVSDGTPPDLVVNGTMSCKVSNNTTYQCGHTDTEGRSWSADITVKGDVVTGSYVMKWDGDIIKVTYNNFGPTSGVATVEGSDGTKAVYTRKSATAYTAVFTDKDGKVTTYNYS